MIAAVESYFPSLRKSETENRFLYGCIAAGCVFSLSTPGGSVAFAVIKVTAAVVSAFSFLAALCARLVRAQHLENSSKPPESRRLSSNTPPTDGVSLPAPKSPLTPNGNGFTILQAGTTNRSAGIYYDGGMWELKLSNGSKIVIEFLSDNFVTLNQKYLGRICFFDKAIKYNILSCDEIYAQNQGNVNNFVEQFLREIRFSRGNPNTEIVVSMIDSLTGRADGAIPAWLAKLFQTSLTVFATLQAPIKLRFLVGSGQVNGCSSEQLWKDAFGNPSASK